MLSTALAVVIVLVTVRFLSELHRIFNRKAFVWITENQWAIVTGSTDGIGYEFARQLAHKGYNLMLISRNEQKLQKTKQEILEDLSQSAQPTIQIRTLAVDFTRLDIYEQINTFLDTANNQVFVLVNNVGTAADLPNYFLENDFKTRNEQIINANLISLTKMTELALPSMVHQKRGLVINISSASSLYTSPLLCTYAATKSFMNKLTDCLSVEYRTSGITFCTFPVWIVSTKMTHHIRDKFWMPTPKVYVQSALQSIKYKESFQATGYWPHTLMKMFVQFYYIVLSEFVMGKLWNWYFHKMKNYFQEETENSKLGKKQRLNLINVLMK